MADYEAAVDWFLRGDRFRDVFKLLRERLDDKPDWASAALICQALQGKTPWLISHAALVSHDEFVASLGVAIEQQDRALAYLNVELALFAYNTSKSLILMEDRLSIGSSSYGSGLPERVPGLYEIHKKVASIEATQARVLGRISNVLHVLIFFLVFGFLSFVVTKVLTFFGILSLTILP